MKEKNRYEAERWLKTAESDLHAARDLSDRGHYAQACFFCQQSAEKVLRAIWYLHDLVPQSHSIQKLVQGLPDHQLIVERNDWAQRAAFLDRFYLATRYPNGLPDLTPGEIYFQSDADAAIEQAAFFVEGARTFIHSKKE